MKKLILALIMAMAPSVAFAQGLIQTKPYGVTTADNQSSTISVTNTFQQVFAASVGRTSCSIQNNGSNAMYVFFGDTSVATIAKSVKLSAGQSVNCDSNDVVIRTAVQITGTSTDVYYATQW